MFFGMIWPCLAVVYFPPFPVRQPKQSPNTFYENLSGHQTCHVGSSSVVVGILPKPIDRGYFAVVQKFLQERARGCNRQSFPSSSSSSSFLSSAGYDNNNPNCVINSIWKQDTNEVYYMAPSAAVVCNLAGWLAGQLAKLDYRVFIFQVREGLSCVIF